MPCSCCMQRSLDICKIRLSRMRFKSSSLFYLGGLSISESEVLKSTTVIFLGFASPSVSNNICLIYLAYCVRIYLHMLLAVVGLALLSLYNYLIGLFLLLLI